MKLLWLIIVLIFTTCCGNSMCSSFGMQTIPVVSPTPPSGSAIIVQFVDTGRVPYFPPPTVLSDCWPETSYPHPIVPGLPITDYQTFALMHGNCGRAQKYVVIYGTMPNPTSGCVITYSWRHKHIKIHAAGNALVQCKEVVRYTKSEKPVEVFETNIY